MDLMEIRRGLLMAMAAKGGADYVSGTFTAPSSGSSYALDFGKSFSSYMFLIEMTDDSKDDLINTGATGPRTFAFLGVYPAMAINNIDGYSVLVSRITPSTSALSTTYITSFVCSKSGIRLAVGGTGNANNVYNGYSYKYTVVSLDNI